MTAIVFPFRRWLFSLPFFLRDFSSARQAFFRNRRTFPDRKSFKHESKTLLAVARSFLTQCVVPPPFSVFPAEQKKLFSDWCSEKFIFPLLQVFSPATLLPFFSLFREIFPSALAAKEYLYPDFFPATAEGVSPLGRSRPKVFSSKSRFLSFYSLEFPQIREEFHSAAYSRPFLLSVWFRHQCYILLPQRPSFCQEHGKRPLLRSGSRFSA